MSTTKRGRGLNRRYAGRAHFAFNDFATAWPGLRDGLLSIGSGRDTGSEVEVTFHSVAFVKGGGEIKTGLSGLLLL